MVYTPYRTSPGPALPQVDTTGVGNTGGCASIKGSYLNFFYRLFTGRI